MCDFFTFAVQMFKALLAETQNIIFTVDLSSEPTCKHLPTISKRGKVVIRAAILFAFAVQFRMKLVGTPLSFVIYYSYCVVRL